MQRIVLLLLALVTGETEERWFILFPTSRLSMIAVYLSVDFVCFYASFEPAVVWFPIGLLYTAPVDLLHMNSTARIYGIRRLLVCPIGNLQSTKRNKKKEFCFYSIYHTFFKNKQFTFPFFVLLYLRPLFRWVCLLVVRACQHSNRLMAWKSSTRILTR